MMKKLNLLFLFLSITVLTFAQVNHSGTISADETWFAADNPHTVTGNITVSDGVTLTIEPGCIVQINTNRRITVSGAMAAFGTSADPILFTSSSGTPAPGDWRYIYFNSADPGSGMSYCTVSYGGSSNSMVLVRNSTDNVTFSNCTFSYSGNYGLRLQNADANPSIADCAFENNSNYPLYTYADRVPDITGNNTFSGNSPDAIYVRRQNINTGIWFDQGVPYVINGNCAVNDAQTLVLTPGVEILFDGTNRFTVNGALLANGTAIDRIKFSSNQPVQEKGDWNRIYFNGAESSSLSFCDFEYGGSASSTIDIRNSGENVTIDNITITNSGGYGIYNRNGSYSFISNVTIDNCDNYPIYCLGNGVTNITGLNSFSGNTPQAIFVRGETLETAQWKKQPVPYVLGQSNFTVADVETLTIDPGVVMKFDGNRQFIVFGALKANGTMAEPITFTSNAATPAKGDWRTIDFREADEDCILNYCNISYGGSSNAMIYIRNNTIDPVTISNCNINNSATLGIRINADSDALISDCSLSDCNDFPIFTYGDKVKHITGNMLFTGNTPNAIRVNSQAITTATWLDFDVPYVMWGNMDVADFETLTLNPGVELQFTSGRRLRMLGSLVADGDMGSEITFTSYETTPAAGDWQQLFFDGTENSVLDYCNILYSGSNANGAVYVRNGGNLSITNCFIDQSDAYGIRVATSADPLIADTEITNCADYPIRTAGDKVKNITGTMSFSGNNPEAIRVDAQTITNGTWLDHGVPYVMWGDMNQADATTLTLNPGVELNFNSNARLRVYGTLVANGSELDPILFTSNQTTPAPGDWERLWFDGADAGTMLNYCQIMYGGGSTAGVQLSNSGTNVSIMNTLIENNANDGLFMTTGSSPTVLNSTIKNNNDIGVYINGACSPTFGSSELEWNEFYDNGSFGLRNGTLDIEAKYVYWGTSACNEISDQIYDDEDQGNLGIVDYLPYLDENLGLAPLATTWTGAVSTSWSNNDNWDNASPCDFSDIYIDGAPANQPVVSGTESCNNLTMGPGSQLTIGTGNLLTVEGDLFLEADATGTPSLVEFNSLQVNGVTTSQLYVPEDRWNYIAPPMDNQIANTFFGMYLYGHDELTNDWVNISDENAPLEVGVGYKVWSEPASPGSVSVDYSGGTLGTGTYSLPVTNTGSGWNFVGNPYPSAIDWDDLSWTKNDIDGTVWVYDGVQYLSWNGTTGGLTGGIIPAMQGFFVLANGPNPNLVVANSARTHGMAPYKETSVDDLLKLTINGNGLYDMMFVNFNNEASAGIDSKFDSRKILGLEEAPQLYSFVGEEIMSVNTFGEISEDLVVPVGLQVSNDGEYTIYASELNTFDNDVEIYLEDITEDVMIDLNQQADYTFNASTGDVEHRFNIHFYKTSTVQTVEESDELYIYSNANSVYVKNRNADLNNAIIDIYNISGQKVFAGELTNIPVNKIDLNLESGYYIVKVITTDNVSSQKVFIK